MEDILRIKLGICEENTAEVCNRTGLDPEDVDDLQEELMTTLLDNIEEARQAFATGENEALTRYGHSLKGGAGQIGMKPLMEIGLQMEEAAKSGDISTWESLAEELKARQEIWQNAK